MNRTTFILIPIPFLFREHRNVMEICPSKIWCERLCLCWLVFYFFFVSQGSETLQTMFQFCQGRNPIHTIGKCQGKSEMWLVGFRIVPQVSLKELIILSFNVSKSKNILQCSFVHLRRVEKKSVMLSSCFFTWEI
jgi:hypothetical protein